MTNEDLTNEQALEQLREWRWMMSAGDVTNPLHRHNIETIDKAIQALEQRWIPVSERLPEVGKKVLCQCQANIYEVLKLTVDGWYHDENHCYMLGFVIAWMPLPEPYKEDAEC